MDLKKIIPSMPELLREALIVLGGAAIAAIAYRLAPDEVKKFLTFSNDK